MGQTSLLHSCRVEPRAFPRNTIIEIYRNRAKNGLAPQFCQTILLSRSLYKIVECIVAAASSLTEAESDIATKRFAVAFRIPKRCFSQAAKYSFGHHSWAK
jgi:hypothetical protein